MKHDGGSDMAGAPWRIPKKLRNNLKKIDILWKECDYLDHSTACISLNNGERKRFAFFWISQHNTSKY